MVSIRLSDNEKAVLLSMMRNPEHSDKDRSGSLNMNLYTFNKIKNNLTREGFLKREFVPNYGLLGFEIMLASYGSRMDPFVSEKAKKLIGTEIQNQAPTHMIFFLTEPGQGIGFHAIEDFTSMKNGLLRAERRIFDALEIERSEMSMVPFSIKEMKVERMFDLYTLVSDTFQLGMEIPLLEPSTPGQEVACLPWADFFQHGSKGRTLDLAEDEWAILEQLVSFPDAPDQFHVERYGMSRYRFKKIRDRLFKERIIKPLVMPNPTAIGFNVLIFSHMKFKSSVDVIDLFESQQWEMPRNLIMTIFDRQEAIGIGLYTNLSDGSRAHHGLLNAMGRMNMLDGTPNVLFFSLTNTDSTWPLTFAKPLIQKGNWRLSDELIEWLKGISSSDQGSQHRM